MYFLLPLITRGPLVYSAFMIILWLFKGEQKSINVLYNYWYDCGKYDRLQMDDDIQVTKPHRITTIQITSQIWSSYDQDAIEGLNKISMIFSNSNISTIFKRRYSATRQDAFISVPLFTYYVICCCSPSSITRRYRKCTGRHDTVRTTR